MAKAPEALDPSIWHPELLAGPLRNKRLTVLYGAPGPLRDGMVRRGLMPLLRQPTPHPRGRPRRQQVPIRFDGWGPLPLQALRTRIDAEFSAAWPHGSPETLAAHLRAIGRQHHATVLLVLDAFERHLGERAERHDIERFDIELSECITHDAVPVHVLMVVDELENRALQRYTRWIATFGDDFLRLPSLLSPAADASAWRDTDILAPPEDVDDEPVPPDDEADWPVDLSLDLTLPAADAAAPAPVAAQAATSNIAAAVAPTAPTTPTTATAPPAPAAPSTPVPPPVAAAAPPPLAAEPDPTPEPLTFDAWEAFGTAHDDSLHNVPTAASAADTSARSNGRVRAQTERIEPVLFGDTPPATQAVPPSNAAPAAAAQGPPAAAATQPFGAWPPLPPPAAPRTAPTPPHAPRSVPPWLSEAEVEQMRRSQERSPRWPALLGLVIYMTLLFAGAWWVARWIIDSQRVETRPRPLDNPPAATAPPATTSPAPQPAPAPRSTAPAPQAAAPATSPRTLTLALPSDAGAAVPMIDELTRRVATPAGLELRTAPGTAAAALTLMRTDALLAARAANAPPLQVVAPLFNEQVQVLVRTDARWDYVRDIKALRLNIGRADSARARTARAMYQQMFGTPLPDAQANELDLEAALRSLQQRGGPIDAVVVVSDVPIESQLQPAMQRQVRELTIDARQMATVTSMPAFSISRRTPQDRARLSTTTYLVAPGTPPRPHEAALRTLAATLCRAQPALQSQGSPLLRGWRQGQQPDVGWSYVLPRTPNAACPSP